MNRLSPVTVEVNDRDYAFPKVPAIAICLDGCEPAYLDAAIAAGLMPALEAIKAKGTVRTAHSVIPSFTNPNNMSIATGRPPSVHGICGNYLFDPETGEEVMMNDPRFLRAPTVFKGFYDIGARIAVVTAKDKLRALLGHGLRFDEDRAICFSAEKSDIATKAPPSLNEDRQNVRQEFDGRRRRIQRLLSLRLFLLQPSQPICQGLADSDRFNGLN